MVPDPGATPLFSDTFETGKKAEWLDVWGGTTASGGVLSGNGGETLTVVSGLPTRDVVVDADIKVGIPFGIVMRYLDSGNFVLANYNPGQGMLYFHERLNGAWGNTWSVVSPGAVSGVDGHMTATANGSTVTMTLSSGSGSATTSYTLTTLLGPGLVGVVTENTLQQISNFVASVPYTPVDVLADAVQVIIPASASIPSGSLPHKDDNVCVTGIAGKGLSLGNLRAVTLRKLADLGPVN